MHSAGFARKLRTAGVAALYPSQNFRFRFYPNANVHPSVASCKVQLGFRCIVFPRALERAAFVSPQQKSEYTHCRAEGFQFHKRNQSMPETTLPGGVKVAHPDFLEMAGTSPESSGRGDRRRPLPMGPISIGLAVED